MNYRIFFPLCGVLVTGALALPVVARAQGSAGIAISPLTFELTANPGEVVTNELRVTNPMNGSIIIEMEVHDFSAAGEGGDVIIESGEDQAFSMERWIAVAPQQFTVGPGETVPAAFTIRVPENAEPGGHYASVMATIKGSTDVTGAAISQKIGALVLLSVAGTIREELFIREFTVPEFSQAGPIPFLIRLENTGSVHLKPIGFITIADFRGERVQDIELPLKRVLPGNTRKVEMQWNKRYPLGKYTATLVGSFGISNTPVSAVATFWVFPWTIALEVAGALVVAVFILIKSRRRFATAFRILMRGEHAAIEQSSKPQAPNSK